MSIFTRRSLFLVFSIAGALLIAAPALAECANECNPYFSFCSQYCDVCTHQGIDGCDAWEPSTCGDEMGPCLVDTCTPNWSETGRVTQGTYDGRSLNHCNHHLVQWVTLTDANQCNRNSSFYTYSYCDDVIDDYKNGCCYPSCCEGYGELNTQLECDGEHSCSG
jgi:hypothetical protein